MTSDVDVIATRTLELRHEDGTSSPVVVRIAPIQLGQPGRFPTRIGRAIQSGQHSGHNIQPITLGELEHVPEEILCCSGHDH